MIHLKSQTSLRKNRKTNSHFSSLSKRNSFSNFITVSAATASDRKLAYSARQPAYFSQRALAKIKPVGKDKGKDTDYMLGDNLNGKDMSQSPRCQKVLRWKSMENITNYKKDELIPIGLRTPVVAAKNYRQRRLKKNDEIKNLADSCRTKETAITHSAMTPSQTQINELQSMVNFYRSEASQYKNRYQLTQNKILELERKAYEERKKTERVKRIYQSKLRQMRLQEESSKVSACHLFSYPEAKELVPDSIIIEESSEDVSRSRASHSMLFQENSMEMLNLSIESKQ